MAERADETATEPVGVVQAVDAPQPTASDAPIGVFDSGLGGLSVAREVRALLPAEDLIYFADCAYCPYGTRSPDEIKARCFAIAGTLIDRGAKLLIVACNTACAVALPELRARFSVPIVGLEPAVKPATRLTRSRRIAVLATPRTAASERLAVLIRNVASSVEVRTVPAPGLVELVESGRVAGPAAERILSDLIGPLRVWGVDVLVLGCTHYPFLRPVIERVAGPQVHVVDSGEAIARRTRSVLEDHGLIRCCEEPCGSLTVYTSGEARHVAAVSALLLGSSVSTTSLTI
jgi:glutamate racemase